MADYQFAHSHLIGTEVTRLIGMSVIDIRTVLCDMVGRETVYSVIHSLDESARVALTETLPISWVPIPYVEQMLIAVAQKTLRDPLELNRTNTKLSFEKTVGRMMRLVLRFTTDDLLIKGASMIYSKFYDRGSVGVTTLSGGKWLIQIRGRAGMSRMAREAFGMGIETVLKLSGRNPAKLIHDPNPEGADFHLYLHTT